MRLSRCLGTLEGFAELAFSPLKTRGQLNNCNLKLTVPLDYILLWNLCLPRYPKRVVVPSLVSLCSARLPLVSGESDQPNRFDLDSFSCAYALKPVGGLKYNLRLMLNE